MLIKGIYTDPSGNQILTPIAVSALGQILTSTIIPNSVPQFLRTLNGPLLVTSTILQSSLQSAYDLEVGTNAPDSIPAQVISAVNDLNNSNYKLYLGHTQWWYTSSLNGTGWVLFGGTAPVGKGPFGAIVPANHIFTFKQTLLA